MTFWHAFLFGMAGWGLPIFSDVVINEIHYDPPQKTELAEFVELYNSGDSPVSLNGWKLAGGVEFSFPAGSSIAAGGYFVIAENPAALLAKFGVAAAGPWQGLLSSTGESISLKDPSGSMVDQVNYQLGFPWPTVGDTAGYSIELVNPAFENDLGGSWRRSVRGSPSNISTTLIPQKSSWKFFKGTKEPSLPMAAWRELNFNDSAWLTGSAPLGYDSNVPMGTAINDMAGNYTSLYFRKQFQVDDPAAIGSLALEALYDDGFQVWINGKRVLSASLPNREVAYNELATGAARESASYDPFIITSSFLRAGSNVIAVQLHNILLSGSSDCFLDLKLTAQAGPSNTGPTPGMRNAVFETNLPPVIRQVNHTPEQPAGGEPVKITAKITDSDGVSSVQLLYQVVEPGNYIELNDPAYAANWITVPMNDSGAGGDMTANDSIYSATLPASLQVHRRLIRYRIQASDSGDRSLRAPYEDDPEPNFAYFVYDGVPAWQGAVQPGSADAGRAQVQTFSSGEMARLPTYHLIAKRSAVEDATWNSKYGGDLYRWWGTLVYDGKVYDHIRYRARGGVWRYAMGKNMWKFDLNRGHDFEA
ncbi:MAG TPA: lamin tail domain-containing protein, partial [Verrucomicrobiae bacterium]|nr:lamin tail domain-containing protein [Verrucomicrobiae bacterium]